MEHFLCKKRIRVLVEYQAVQRQSNIEHGRDVSTDFILLPYKHLDMALNIGEMRSTEAKFLDDVR